MEDKKRAEKEAAAKALAAEETEAAAVVKDAGRVEKSPQPARARRARSTWCFECFRTLSGSSQPSSGTVLLSCLGHSGPASR